MAGTLNAGALSIAIMADTQKLSQGFASAQSQTRAFAGSFARSFAGVATAIGGAVAAVSALKLAIGEAIKAEQFQTQFKTLLKDGAAAKALMVEIRQFANTTPFETEELAASAKQLLAFGTRGKDVVKTLRILGDVSAATGSRIEDLTYLYGTSQVQGRLFAKDIMQFQSRGVPVVQELARQFGVTTGEITKMVETGQIGFEQLRKALESMTSGSGQFAGGVAALGETLAGKWSTFKDGVKEAARAFGEEIMPTMKQLLPIMSDLIKQTAEWTKHIGKAVAEFGFLMGLGKAPASVGLARGGVTGLSRESLVDIAQRSGLRWQDLSKDLRSRSDPFRGTPILEGAFERVGAIDASWLRSATFSDDDLAKALLNSVISPIDRQKILMAQSAGKRGGEFDRAAEGKVPGWKRSIADMAGDMLAVALGSPNQLISAAMSKVSPSGVLEAIGSAVGPGLKAGSGPMFFGGSPAGPGRAEFRGNDAVLAGSVEAARLAAIQRMRLPHETEAVKIQRQQLATLKSIDKKAGAVPANVLVAF